nr:hypothetical protein [Bacillus cereus]
MHKKFGQTYRKQDGRKKLTSFCIVDAHAQSVKNTWTAGTKGYATMPAKKFQESTP